jgi:glycosyltransferase involved in cell wall biosynthesis
MRVLFCYRYGILGGVCTQLINRLRLHDAEQPFESHLLFGADYGISSTLEGYPHLHFEQDPGRVRALAKDAGYDAAVVIDSPEYLSALEGVPGLPVVTEVHTTVERGLSYLGNRNWKTAGFIVPSEYSRRLLRDRFGVPESETIAVVPNCLDMRLFPRGDVPVAPARPVYAWIGKLDDHKNWRGFLEVAALVAAHGDCEFWLVGGYTAPADDEAALIEEMNRHGLSDRCRWFPRIEYKAMHRLFGAVRQSGGAAIVTSVNESFGMSVLEALACGCPVVSSEVGALPEIAPSKPYLRFYRLGQWCDAADLALAFRGDYGGEARDLLAGDREWLERKYDCRVISEQYEKTLRGIVAEAQVCPWIGPVTSPPSAMLSSTPIDESRQWLPEVERLRAAIPGGETLGDLGEVLRETNRLLRGRSYRIARLLAGRRRGWKELARLPFLIWREVVRNDGERADRAKCPQFTADDVRQRNLP